MENSMITDTMKKQRKTKKFMDYSVLLDDNDNVVTAIKDIPKGIYSFIISGERKNLYVNKKIYAGFKVSILNIKKGEIIYKYGSKIGIAKNNIKPGNKVHIENMSSLVK